MSENQEPVREIDDDLERQTSDYLRQHPDFFKRHDSLVAAMRVPHSAGDGTVSLIERQIEVLRERIATLEAKERDMVEVARENQHLHRKIHRFTLELIGARSASDVVARLQAYLTEEFQTEALTLGLIEGGTENLDDNAILRMLDPDGEELKAFDGTLKGGPLCGRLKHEQLRVLFGENAVEIRSSALVPLGEHGSLGMLAIGSREKGRFQEGMGTEFLNNMGEIISQALVAQS
ncbi:MAG: DUF484 family protein [Gammaproteobacteria bacterium]